jgi:hypothetical protein
VQGDRVLVLPDAVQVPAPAQVAIEFEEPPFENVFQLRLRQHHLVRMTRVERIIRQICHREM